MHAIMNGRHSITRGGLTTTHTHTHTHTHSLTRVFRPVLHSCSSPFTRSNFEVTVNGVLVHSKRTKGHGFLERNPEQIEKVFAAIEEALDAKEK